MHVSNSSTVACHSHTPDRRQDHRDRNKSCSVLHHKSSVEDQETDFLIILSSSELHTLHTVTLLLSHKIFQYSEEKEFNIASLISCIEMAVRLLDLTRVAATLILLFLLIFYLATPQYMTVQHIVMLVCLLNYGYTPI